MPTQTNTIIDKSLKGWKEIESEVVRDALWRVLRWSQAWPYQQRVRQVVDNRSEGDQDSIYIAKKQ